MNADAWLGFAPQKRAESFCEAFVEAYRCCRDTFPAAERWREVLTYEWSKCMLWNPPQPLAKPILEMVATSLGLQYWDREPFRLDGAFLGANASRYGSCVVPLLVGIEHENDLSTFDEEITKLAHIRCPLKVGITYEMRAHRVERAKERIVGYASSVLGTLEKLTGAESNTAYVFLLGVDALPDQQEGCELEWQSLSFEAPAAVAVATWRRLG